jgi:transposase-like protein
MCHGDSPVHPRYAETPMPRLSAEPIVMTPAHEQVLARLVRAHTTPRKLAECAQLILLAAAGTGVREIARQLGVWPKTVRHWLRRWRTAAEAAPVAQRLADAERPGAPATFTPSRSARLSPWPARNQPKRAIFP